MFRSLTKAALLTCAVAAVSTPSVSEAGLFDCFRGWRGGGCDPCCGTTTYRPLFPRFGLFRARRVSYYGGGCNTCCSPCNTCCSPCTTCYRVKYVPQTCYRASVCNVPVTTCRRVTCCDPCTGCPVTVCRPCTTYVRQVRYTPYTTYRAVCCPTTCCSPCCDPCCNPCCNGGTTVQSTTPINGGTVVTPNGGTPNGQTYKEGSSSSFRQSAPRNGGSNPGNYNTKHRRNSAPQRPTPPRNLTTSKPVKKSWTFRRASSRQVQSEAKPATQRQPLDDGGWTSVKR